MDLLSVRYCKTQSDRLPFDALDYVVGAILLIVLFVNLGCSAYQFLWPEEKGKGNVQYPCNGIHKYCKKSEVENEKFLNKIDPLIP